MPVLRNCQLYTYHSVIYPRAARHRPDNPVSSYRLIIESAHSDRDLRLGTPVGTPSSAVCAHRYRPIYLAYSLSTRSIHLSIYILCIHPVHAYIPYICFILYIRYISPIYKTLHNALLPTPYTSFKC